MSLFDAPIRITLTPYELERFTSVSPDPSQGGPARLYIELSLIRYGDNLSLEDETLLKVNRYAYAYGSGGYQNAFRAIIAAANRAGWEAPDSPHDVRHNPSAAGRRWSGD